ncbi:hypothetical protein [Fibrella aquatica]|uniref:hypothetical protein n=1 Tax=Fibrella aquatica TaxID=3242487 RepID=UPI00352031C6
MKTLSHTEIFVNNIKTSKLEKQMPFSLLNKIVTWSFFILGIFSILQILIFPSLNTVVAVTVVVLSHLILNTFVLKSNVLRLNPISSFVIIGFFVTQLFFPLVFSLIEYKPITFNLLLPNEVFVHSILILSTIILSHIIYRNGFSKFSIPIRFFLKRKHFYSPPTDSQLWVMGWIGLIGMFYIHFFTDVNDEMTSNIWLKFIQGLIPFTYAPYFILVGNLYGRKNTKMEGILYKILTFTLVLFIVSIGSNIRSAFMLGFTSVGFSMFLGMMLGVLRPKVITPRNVFLGVFALWFFTGPVADLGKAMVVARASKSSFTSKFDFVYYTYDIYVRDNLYPEKSSNVISSKFEWDEYYMDNIFLAKFCNLKFNDSSLLDAETLSTDNSVIYNYTIDRALAILPSPLLQILSVDIDKSALNIGSFGDFMYFKSGRGNSNSIGGKRTGHLAGSSMAAFGWWYLFILLIGMIPVYILLDTFITYPKHYISPDKYIISKLPQFSLCILIVITSVFQFLPGESITLISNFLFRGWIQTIFLYFVMYNVSLFLVRFFPKTGHIST